MSIRISNFSQKVEAYLNKLGKLVTVKTDNGEEQFFAVVQQTWRKNKSKFEDTASKIGQVYNDYYEYFGPASFDITALKHNDYLLCDGVKYFFVRTQRVIVGGHVQYYTGVLKRVWEEDGNVFN